MSRDGKRPIKTKSFIWCDHHGTVHPAELDYYQEAWDLDENRRPEISECNPDNWRPVYIWGDPGEEF